MQQYPKALKHTSRLRAQLHPLLHHNELIREEEARL